MVSEAISQQQLRQQCLSVTNRFRRPKTFRILSPFPYTQQHRTQKTEQERQHDIQEPLLALSSFQRDKQ
jgi:hypothetical protein